MLFSDVTPDRRSVVIVNASMTVSSCKANKICLEHITLKMISTERIADSQGVAFFFSFGLISDLILRRYKYPFLALRASS